MAAILGKYVCANCDHEFNEHELICEDWSDPNKRIICPECRYYLVPAPNWKSKYAIALIVFAFVLGIVLTFTSELQGRQLTGTMVFIALPAMLWAYGNPFSPTKTNAIGKSKI